ncbi:1-aminocyclopropane-1-carboxylate oxidase homolog 1-like [Syzygium oleosum]|uniref:1-aminocyclopropane-1-carboxylate oxidase homolog 1-like n=1 Tax=Syzygium oleosum TaxID=219896 RepID=UPI0024B99F43|nr:1-aminocyclopropane-1-carboxylate oxidase homolog 1-like [Syzygium oleosum]
MPVATSIDDEHDRASKLRAFDETKAGVKGLVDAGITQVPCIFVVRPPDNTFTVALVQFSDASQHLWHKNAGGVLKACDETGLSSLTLGVTEHSDNDFLTILLQDQIGRLQVLHENQWIDVPPIPGALVIDIGDLLQVQNCLNETDVR